jgi:hypothetical protein
MISAIGGTTVPIALRQCPVCDEPMVIRELYCSTCDVTIRGQFAPGSAGPFSHLNDEQLAFLHLFVTSRGNMSDVERSLGVSYPTVRAKLDDLIAALTESDSPEPPSPPPARVSSPAPEAPVAPTRNRREILAQIAEGKLSVQEGMDLMKRLPEE